MIPLQVAGDSIVNPNLSPFFEGFISGFYAIVTLLVVFFAASVWFIALGFVATSRPIGPPLSGILFLVPVFGSLYIVSGWEYALIQQILGAITALYIFASGVYLILLWTGVLQFSDFKEEVRDRA